MCGILFCCQSAAATQDGRLQEVFERLKAVNAKRGPDADDAVHLRLKSLDLTFCGSELRLRGDAETVQPHRNEKGDVLCWNGEIFEGIKVLPDENDGEKLFSILQSQVSLDDVQDVLGRIEGPYAIVYYSPTLRKLFFARDPLGRRSLLMHRPTVEQPWFFLASVSAGSDMMYSMEELSTKFIYYLDIGTMHEDNVVNDFSVALQTISRLDYSTSRPFANIPRVNITLPLNDPPIVAGLDHIPEHLSEAVDDLITHLNDSTRLRVINIPQKSEDCGKTRVGVLFSGGIDSAIVAYFAHRHVDPSEPIDLLNVAFENPRNIQAQTERNINGLAGPKKKKKSSRVVEHQSTESDYNVPDRLTGLEQLEELRRLSPGRTWNFVEVNVPYEEYLTARPIVETLMWPGRTVMDFSLAIALYFSARGVGQVRSHSGAEPKSYTSPARVLLNGLGSDELLGGYGRFRTAYNSRGWQGIVDEFQLELDRIPTRNLGRDDRVISSHGKEVRHPFLSLSVVSFLAKLPVHLKTDPRLETGLGEKMLLRLAARKLGLVEASGRKKRAMQFGSRSARMDPAGSDRNGVDVACGAVH